MKRIILSTSLLCSGTLWAGFNFGECSGSGTFAQHINAYGTDKENAVTVGTIPKGIQGLEVNLTSEADVDIRLYADNGDKIVHWPSGILKKAQKETKSYKDTKVTYSGYNGVNGKRGHEFIKVEGSTPSLLTMKAFGYNEGDATVNYSWTGKDGCSNTDSGKGHFTQKIPNKAIAVVGEIPANIENLEVSLKSNKDIDIQLYGVDGTAIIAWPKGLLHGSKKDTITYNGMNIEWSGYYGVNGKAGHEYIKITGKTTEKMTMKVYGYESGKADVDYSWGHRTQNENNDLKILKTGSHISFHEDDDADLQLGETRSYSRNHSKQVVIDNVTGLMWQDNNETIKIVKSWVTEANYKKQKYQDTSGDTASTYCTNLTLGDYNDWRLPTIDELANLTDYGKRSPAIDSLFLNVDSNDRGYWSSTSNGTMSLSSIENPSYAFRIRSEEGDFYPYAKNEKFYVRCVRNK